MAFQRHALSRLHWAQRHRSMIPSSQIRTAVPGDSPSHLPVLADEVGRAFAHSSLRSFVDATVGAGGHARRILDEHPELEAFIGIDKDARALEEAGERLARVSTGAKVHLARCNFQDLKGWVTRILEQEGSDGIDGVVFDIGVSSMQLDEAERGFSFMRDGPLDMRMDRGSSLSAERVVNEWSESELGRILRDYGEERRWHQVAKRIVDRRQDGRIETTKQLAEAIGKQRPSEGNAKRKLNPATRAFQAIRIAVNDELNALEEALPDAYDLLAPGGRMAVLSFHSLEDRIVKRFCFDRVKRLGGNIVTKKPIEPGQVEAETSPRSRSAKLRIVEKPKEVCS